ncbi:MAG: ABC transporter substrate-binding protein [Bacteroidales bacterium]|nr:ABC transporter substrate-binding protein [Bacteroidales bacterium]MDD3430720.1 ABC transporter substrate-binding protein [Bacteroidales bacterium]MDD4361000.1 ABC transporter substrate-binding protein [Bacteroidales bacterium]MDD4430918.1 ABC transporter substrate-binding protein [Bacteroidales bacterium]
MKIKNFIALLILLIFVTACNKGPAKITVGYVQINEDEVLNVAKEGVFEALADSGFVVGENIKLIDNNAQGDLSMIITILQSLQSRGVDLIITNSTPCMMAAAQLISDIPVVFTVAFGPEQMGLKTIPDNFYGYYDPLDSKQFADMLLEVLPYAKRIGIPYNNAEPNAAYSADKFSKEFESRGIEVVKSALTSVNDIVMVGQNLVAQKIDALIVTADNTVYSGLNALSKVAGEAKVPLFVSDPLQAEKGAAIGLGVNYRQWGYLSGLKAVELLRGRTPAKKIEAIRETDFVMNEKACMDQALFVPPVVKERARLTGN